MNNRKRKGFPRDLSSQGFLPYVTSSNSNSNSNTRVMWDPDGDGYDGASERGRCETDGFEDFNTDGDVEFEEIEEREDQYSNSSGSGYDGSVDADGGASDTYATDRNTVMRCTLLSSSIAMSRGQSPSMQSQDSSVSGRGKGRLRTSSSISHPHSQGYGQGHGQGQGQGQNLVSGQRSLGTHNFNLAGAGINTNSNINSNMNINSNSNINSNLNLNSNQYNNSSGMKRSKRRKTHSHSLYKKDSCSKENTDDQR